MWNSAALVSREPWQPVDREDVSKSLYVIAGLGLTGCVVMSMMMQHVLKVKGDKDVPAAAKDLQDLYGSRLSDYCTIDVDETPDRTIVAVGVHAQGGMGTPRLARSIGEFVWRRYAVRQVVDEVIVTLHEPGREAQEISVPAPLLARRKYRAGGSFPEIPAPRPPEPEKVGVPSSPGRSGSPSPAPPVPGTGGGR